MRSGRLTAEAAAALLNISADELQSFASRKCGPRPLPSGFYRESEVRLYSELCRSVVPRAWRFHPDGGFVFEGNAAAFVADCESRDLHEQAGRRRQAKATEAVENARADKILHRWATRGAPRQLSLSRAQWMLLLDYRDGKRSPSEVDVLRPLRRLALQWEGAR